MIRSDPSSADIVEGYRMMKRAGSLGLSVLFAAGFALWINAKQAHAYIDVGSATFFIQMLIASAFGALFTLKVFWQRILERISRFLTMVKGSKKTS